MSIRSVAYEDGQNKNNTFISNEKRDTTLEESLQSTVCYAQQGYKLQAFLGPPYKQSLCQLKSYHTYTKQLYWTMI